MNANRKRAANRSKGPPAPRIGRRNRRFAFPHESEAVEAGRLAAIVEHSHDAIFIRTFARIVTSWNNAAAQVFGYDAAEMLGRSSDILLPSGQRDELEGLLSRVRRGEPVPQYEADRCRKDGRRVRVLLRISPIRSSAGRVTGCATIARNITHEEQARQTQPCRERELDMFFDGASIGLLLASPEGVVLRANQAFCALLERNSGQVVGRSLPSFHPDGGTLEDFLRRLLKHETLRNVSAVFHGGRGGIRHVLVDADGLWEEGRLVHSRWFVRDISRRRQLERELLEISDRERRGFAQELHDGLGQQLGGIAYLANVLRQRLIERTAPEVDEATRIFNLVRKAIEDTRRMARGLSPIRDEPEGLMDALWELAAQTSEVLNVRCRLICRKRILVNEPVVASHLYRIAQEAVNNAVKHGRAATITLSLRRRNTRLILTVADNGRGMRSLPPNGKGLGLRIMQYRAGLLRGTLEMRPRPKRGTEIICTVPLSAHDSAQPTD
jgi:PAS domain S-box-containing protein